MTSPSSTTSTRVSKETTTVNSKVTFVMSGDPFWNLDDTARREIAGCWLEEEEWFLRNGVLQLLDMVRVVTTYCNYLARDYV